MRSSGRSISPVALIYIGTPVSLLGILPLMAITGLISDEDIEPAGIAFGLLFGLIFGGSGTLAVYIGLINAMENSLGQSSPFFLRLLQMVWRRASLVSLKASAPYFVLALVIFLLIVIDDGLIRLQREDLKDLVVLEFFAIHSSAFLGIIAFVRWKGSAFLLQIFLFAAFLGLYGYAAYQLSGFSSAAVFTVLIASKYLSYLVKPVDLRTKGKLVIRWFTNVIIFTTLAALFGIELEAQDNLEFAASYFLILGIFETFSLMAPKEDHKRDRRPL
jgi:hypothetical protein